MQEQTNHRPPERVIAYIDGFNLYFGMREGYLDRFYWLDVAAMVQTAMRPHQQLIAVKYFTARVNFPSTRVKRQGDYLEALGTCGLVKVYYGQYEGEIEKCETCGAERTFHAEKMTDVNIALEITKDAHADRFDTALLVTGDSDQTPTIRLVRDLFQPKRVLAMFPPNRYSNRLKAAADAILQVKNHMLSKSQLPPVVTTASGVQLMRPASWSHEAGELRRAAKLAATGTASISDGGKGTK